MQHKFKLATLSSLLCANAFATPVYQPPGPNLTYGSSSNNQSIMSSIANPAAAAAVLRKEDSQYRFGIISLGGGYEIGNVNDLFNQIDNSKNTITTPIDTNAMATLYLNACGTTTTCSNPSQFASDIATFINTSAAVTTLNNTVLPALQRDGNASVFFGGHVPFTPFVIARKGWGGSIVFDANVSAVANMSFIEDPLFINPTTAGNIATNYQAAVNSCNCPNPTTYTVPTIPNDSTMLIKGAVVAELGLGYSRSIFTREASVLAEGEQTPGALSASELKAGELTAGVRLKYYQVKLANDAESFKESSTGAQSTLKKTLTYTTNSGVGLDVGTLWTSKHYRAGAWVNNLNSPSFKYKAIDTTGYTNPTIIAQLTTDRTYTMKPQLQLEGAVYTQSQNWVVNAGLDANAVKDPVGRDFQWMTLSGAYATSSWWIPGARVGYRSNLAGSKLSYVTAGLTIFKALSLDIAYGLDKLTYEGKSIPRSAMINLGLQMTF